MFKEFWSKNRYSPPPKAKILKQGNLLKRPPPTIWGGGCLPKMATIFTILEISGIIIGDYFLEFLLKLFFLNLAASFPDKVPSILVDFEPLLILVLWDLLDDALGTLIALGILIDIL